MKNKDKTVSDLFDDSLFDPVETATGKNNSSRKNVSKNSSMAEKKKKAGFYLSVDMLERFTRKFHELKLAGKAIENKSALAEIALSFALDDIDRGNKSLLLKRL